MLTQVQQSGVHHTISNQDLGDIHDLMGPPLACTGATNYKETTDD